MKTTVKEGIYIENGHRMRPIRLAGRVYAKAMESMIGVCADAIIIEKSAHVIHLPKRVVRPMQGWWSIGGRRMPGESPRDAVARKFEKETSLKISPRRFDFVSIQEVIWKDRKENPKNIGKHDLIHFFRVELTPKERKTVSENLDPNEYEKGLTAFDRKSLVAKKVHPAILANYDLIFRARK